MELTQPVATILAGMCGGTIGGTLAIVGVRWTLRAAALRTVQEQLERRAKERERLLQDAYAKFVAAAYCAMRPRARLGIPPASSMDGESPAEQLVVVKTSDRDGFQDKLNGHLDDLTLALAHIQLIDGDTNRLEQVEDLENQISRSLNLPEGPERAALRHAVDDIVVNMSVSIQYEYHEARELAAIGKLPENDGGEIAVEPKKRLPPTQATSWSARLVQSVKHHLRSK